VYPFLSVSYLVRLNKRHLGNGLTIYRRARNNNKKNVFCFENDPPPSPNAARLIAAKSIEENKTKSYYTRPLHPVYRRRRCWKIALIPPLLHLTDRRRNMSVIHTNDSSASSLSLLYFYGPKPYLPTITFDRWPGPCPPSLSPKTNRRNVRFIYRLPATRSERNKNAALFAIS